MNENWLTIETHEQDIILRKCSKEAKGVVTIPEGVTTISLYAFSGCKNVTSVKLPLSLKIIYGGAFSGCTSLSSIKIPANVERISRSAFKDCKSLASINIPDMASVANGAFNGCDGIIEIILPKRIVALRGLSKRRLNHIFDSADFTKCILIASHEIKKELIQHYLGSYNIKYV